MDSEHVIKRDSFDSRAFHNLSLTTPTLSSAVGASGEPFVQDIFSSLFKLTPTLVDNTTARHKPVIEQMMAMREWSEFRETTRLNEVASALGTVELASKLAKQIPPEPDANGRAVRATDPDKQRQAIRRAVKQAAEEVGEQMEAYDALACGHGNELGDGAKVPPTAVMETFQRIRNSAKLAAIARLAGRMKRIAARKHKERARHGADELADVEQGRNLARVLPSELALMDNDETELEFLRKYSEGTLLQYRLEANTPKGKGPIVFCLDSSGSMSGQKEVWSKALALGLMTIAALERRPFVLIHFGSSSQIRIARFGKKVDPNALLAELDFFFNGGTDFDAPIGFALTEIESATYRKADIVFLTDGEAPLSPLTVERLQAEKKANGTCFYTILVSSQSRVLDAISDGVASVYDLSKDGAALDLAFEL